MIKYSQIINNNHVSDEHQTLSKVILSLPRPIKRFIVLLFDIIFCFLAVFISFYLRLGDYSFSIRSFLIASSISTSISLPIFIIIGLYREIFRYLGWTALRTVLKAVLIYAFFYSSVITMVSIPGIPRTIGLIQPLMLLLFIGASRLFAHYWLGGIYQKQLIKSYLPKALIYGAGYSGDQLSTALSNSDELHVIGFVDDDPRLHGNYLNNIPIYSFSDLDGLIKNKNITNVLLAMPSIPRKRRHTIIKEIGKRNITVRTVPSVSELAKGKVTISDLHDLDIDDLLGREPVDPNHILLSRNITDKTILVTGAGGSIGSEICRQISHLKFKKLLLLDMCEFALYSIHSEISESHTSCNDSSLNTIIPLLVSVQDENKIFEVMDTWKPDTVYHAAAYKHVPLVEHNLTEGIRNNVFGTLITAKASINSHVSDFVLVSTDKAVRPTNVMGASKRLSEVCLQSLFYSIKNHSKTKFSIVRFGNVLDSSGSVIPRFRKQIKNWGPVTLTHPDITRYFMTITEAAQLVIQAGAMAKGGDVFVLDMGAPVRIYDLALSMIKLSGLTLKDKNNPEGDIEIIITGLRPGEKLYEELLLGDDPQPTLHSKIFRAQDPFMPWKDLEPEIEKLKLLISQNKVETVLKVLKRLVFGFKPGKKLVDLMFVEQSSSLYKSNRISLKKNRPIS